MLIIKWKKANSTNIIVHLHNWNGESDGYLIWLFTWWNELTWVNKIEYYLSPFILIVHDAENFVAHWKAAAAEQPGPYAASAIALGSFVMCVLFLCHLTFIWHNFSLD